MRDELYLHHRDEWLTLVGKYYDEYISKCKCDPDDCDCLSFECFEDKFLDEQDENNCEVAQ